MKYVAAIALVASVAFAQSGGARCRDRRNMRLDRTVPCGAVASTSDAGSTFALSFATDSIDMGAPCACASVAGGSNGETVSAVRASAAMCTKYNWIDNIAVGDLVSCAADQLRVMPGLDGGGGLGFMSEAIRHNYVTSQDFTALPWVTIGSVTAPTVSNPDAGLCPDGTNRATRIRLPATTSSEYSFIYNLTACPNGGSTSLSAYTRGYSGDGGVDLVLIDGLSVASATRHGYRGEAWNRILREGFASSTTSMSFGSRGPALAVPAAEPAADFLICFMQCEIGDHTSSYTPDDRAGDQVTASVSVPLGYTDLTITANLISEKGTPTSSNPIGIAQSYASYVNARVDASGMACSSTWSSLPDVITATGTSVSPNTVGALSCSYAGTDTKLMTACYDGGCGSGTVQDDGGVPQWPLYTLGANTETLEFGGHLDQASFKSQVDGIIRNVNITSTSRKSIYLYGDSIVAQPDYTSPTYYGVAQQVIHAAKGNAVAVQNNGNSGDNIAQCEVRWNATTAAIRANPSTASRSYMMIQCGTNSLDSVDSGYITDRLKFMLADAADAGAHPLWSTITPRDDHCAQRVIVNNAMTTWCAANGIPRADTDTPLLATPGDECSGIAAQYARDGVHFNDAGTVLMTNVWITAGGW